MLKNGDYNQLKIVRNTSVGFYLTDDEGNEVLLPNKYIKDTFDIGDIITVFVYKDYQHRWVATSLKPFLKVNEFAFLRVRSSTNDGSFLEWGLEKDIFVPHAEQKIKMLAGHQYVVYLYEDKKTNRLVGSSKINRYLNNEHCTLQAGAEVDLLIYETTPLGFNAIINQQYKGLIYHDENYQDLSVGINLKGFIKNIREDNTIDLSLRPKGIKNLETGAETILNYLKTHKGILHLHDNSSPDEIIAILKMSKKNFKKSVGILFKQKKILLNEKNITLVNITA